MQIYKHANLIISEIIFVSIDMHKQWQKIYFESVVMEFIGDSSTHT